MSDEDFESFARSKAKVLAAAEDEEFRAFARSRFGGAQEPEAEGAAAPSFLGGVGRSLASGAVSALGGITSALGYVGKKAGAVNPVDEARVFGSSDGAAAGRVVDPGDALSESLLGAGAATEDMARSWSRDVPQSLVNRTAAGVGSMVPYMAAGLATGGLAGVPVVGQLLRSEVETQSNAAQTFQELRRAGYDDETAMRAAQRQEWPDRVVNAALEPFGALSNKGRMVRMGAEAASEGMLQEPFQSITQNASLRSAGGSFGDFARALWDETKRYPQALKEVGVPAAIAGGIVGGVSPGLGRGKKEPAQGPVQVPAGDGTRAAVSALQVPQVWDVFVDGDGVRHTVTKAGPRYTNMTPVDGKKNVIKTDDIDAAGFRRLSPEEIKNGVGLPDISNDFGPSFTEQSGKPISAIARLLKEKKGQVPGALIAPDGAPIDFIYGRGGDGGYGLAHIYEKHGKKVLVRIPQVISNGAVTGGGNSMTFSDGSAFVVLKKEWKGHEKRWVVTAFEKADKSPSGSGQSIGAAGNLTVERPDPLYSLNGDSAENLSQNADGVNELNSIQRFAHEPAMPRGNEVSGVKVGDVKRLISEALNVPVREGQIRKKGLGGFISFNPYNGDKNDIIRIRARNDIASLLHEFGHGIDHLYGLTESNRTREEVWPEFARFGESMGYSPDKWLSEGLAQFYQWRGIDPDQASRMFPKYSKVFDEFMASNPEARAKIEPVFKAARDYYFGSPESRLDAVVGSGKPPRRSPRQWGADMWRKARREVFDRQQVFSEVGDMVAEAVDSPEMMARLGINAEKAERFGLKRMLPNSINLEAKARTMPGKQAEAIAQVDDFLSVMRGFSADEYRALKLYLTAGGGLDYYENGMNPGLGLAPHELRGIRERTPEKVRLAAAALREKYDSMMESTLVDTGMLTRRKLREWRKLYPNYVPMLHEDGDGGYSVLSPQQARERGFVDLQDPIGRRSGVKEASALVSRQDPVVSMLSNYRKFYDLKARNDVAKTLINISRLPGLMRVAERVPGKGPKGPNTFTVWDRGKRRYYATDPEIYEALRSLGEAGVSKAAFARFAGRAAELFKMGTTRYNPWFILKNLVRDSFTASVQSGSRIADPTNLPIVNTFDGVLKLLNDKDSYDSARANGVFYSSMVELSRENVPRLIEDQLSGGRLKECMRSVRAALERLGAANEAVELAPKLREFTKLREMGIPSAQAAMEAREVNTDFQRASNLGREMNRYVPFLNAQLQGLDKAVRTFVQKPVESTMKAGLYLMLPSVLEWLLYHDDEEYKALDKGIKDTHWLFRLPGMEAGSFVRVPMPFELGVLFGGGAKRALDKLFLNDPAASYGYLSSLKEAAVPDLQIALLRPMMEVWANKDSFQDRPIVPLREQKLPARLQYGGSTSYPAKLAGGFGLSPRVADHLIRGYGGTIAGQAAHLFDVFDSSRAPAPARSWSGSTLLRPYTVSSQSSNHYQDRFYSVVEELEREYNGARAERSRSASAGLYEMMNRRRRAIADIWKQIGQVKDSRSMSPAQKKERIDSLTERANGIARMALEVYDRRRGAM
ncbi:MAG: hypothetical protein Q4D58_00705 [Synergistaceae bacterium]|nr:hypothetical protein [Synergistaceae bacterium]